MTDKEILEIDELLQNKDVKLLGWCCVCGKPIISGEWVSVQVVKPDKKGFHIDNIKRHTVCQRNL